MQRKHTTDGHIAVKVKQTFTLFVFIHCKQVFSIVSVLTHSFFSFLLLLNMHFFLKLASNLCVSTFKKKKAQFFHRHHLPNCTFLLLFFFFIIYFLFNDFPQRLLEILC